MAFPASIHVGLLPPSVGTTFESVLWVDTTANILKRFNGSIWVPIALTAAGSGARSLGGVWSPITKTNIGLVYVPIYTAALSQEHLLAIDFTGIFQVRIVFLWSRVGTGTQRVRWVDASNPLNVLVESASFVVTQDPGDTGWVNLPAAFLNQTKLLQQQGKSTVAGDDPIAQGYLVYGR